VSPEDYQKVKQIFQSSLDLGAAERTAYLDKECSGDPQLRVEVDKLLDAFHSEYLEQPAVEEFADRIVTGDLAAGQEIGHYKIREKIGSGGMGEVYLADDPNLSRQVAIKILPREFTGDAERIRRFIREAKFVSALNHPNIVTIHEIRQSDGQHFIATEYIQGETLREHLKRERLSLPSALEIAIQIASALEAAHGAGIIHRDIKPDNIMIRPDGLVKVLDFGVAKLAESFAPAGASDVDIHATAEGTTPGILIGTANYMSPEQARGDEVDERTDIFNFGIVLYEMVSGKRAFDGSNTMDVIGAILHKEPTPLDLLVPELPQAVERITAKALTKDRTERYQTAKDLLIDLKDRRRDLDIKGELERSITPDRKETTSSSPEYAVTKVGQPKFVYLTLAFLLLAGLGFGVYKFSVPTKGNASVELAKIDRVTSSGKAIMAAISPDGKYIVHAVDEAGKQSLWVRQILTGSNIQIVPPAEVAFWGITVSPDGNFAYYTARDAGKGVGTLFRIPVLGGTPVPLVIDIDSPIAISPGGTEMAFVRWGGDDGSSRLFAANIDGTGERELTKREKPEQLGSGGPAWSPDGKTVICVVSTREADTLLSVRVSDGVTTPLTQGGWYNINQGTWYDGDTILMIARDGDPNSTNQVWSLSLPDGQATPITRDLNNYHGVSLSADLKTLVTFQHNTESNVFIGQRGDEDRSKDLTAFKGSITDFSWTPDGRILHDSKARGNWDIYSVKTDGTDQRSLTTDPKFETLPRASADGRYIVFSSNRTGLLELWRMDSDGKNPIQLTTGGGLNSTITPDGKWVVYVTPGGSANRLLKISIDGGEPEQVTTDTGLSVPVVSPDGQMLAYWDYTQNPSKHVLRIMPFSGGSEIKTIELPPTAAGKRVQFSADGQAIIYLDARDGVSNLWSQPVAGGKPKQITNFKAGKILNFAYSPDGKQLAFSRGETVSEVVMISLFRK
jgi:eukaryotic-like serine/threonine-protein kinase